jgi:hypothetical protein
MSSFHMFPCTYHVNLFKSKCKNSQPLLCYIILFGVQDTKSVYSACITLLSDPRILCDSSLTQSAVSHMVHTQLSTRGATVICKINLSYGTTDCYWALASHNIYVHTVLLCMVSCQLQHQRSLAISFTSSSHLNLGLVTVQLPVNSLLRAL